MRFDKAVRIKPGTTYRVSVFAPKGRYAVTEGVLDSRKDRGHLVVLGQRNGVFAYGKSSRFPRQTHNASNYWVDVLFRAGKGGAGGGTGGTTRRPVPPRPDPQPGGFPNADNTGVPAGVALTPYTGPMTITTPGTVIDAKQIRAA